MSCSPCGLFVSGSRRPVTGPYASAARDAARGGWLVRLTDAGRDALADWMVKYPHPIGLLRSAFPRLYRAARSAGFADDEIDATCMEGIVRGFVRFDPTRGQIQTAVTWSVRGAVNDLLRVNAKYAADVPASAAWVRGADAPSAEPAAPETDPFAPESVVSMFQVLTVRERYAVRQRVIEHVKLETIGRKLGVTRERARQIIEVALRKIRDATPA